MEKTRYDVVPSDGGWAVETGGKSTPAFPSKELAIWRRRRGPSRMRRPK